MTRYEQIKAMSKDELARYLCTMQESYGDICHVCDYCPATHMCYLNDNGFKNWLNEEVEDRKMNIKLDKGAFMPIRAHITDAGLDIRAKEAKVVCAKDSAIFHTGVHVQLPKGTAGVLISKSGLNVKHDITSTGLIDEGYDGEIIVKLYNHGGKDYKVEAGDKISQLVVVPVRYEPIDIVEDFEVVHDRGSNGFGSTGK